MDAITREEKYLKAIATGDAGAGLPAPVTRREQYLYAIATSGAGGGGGGGTDPALAERVAALEAAVKAIPAGTTNYNDLSNKPKINNVELTGNKTWAQLGIADGNGRMY